ncbi:glycosyltransferase family 2 protein [Candidatus Daviesbacteria bacterium]|nr:glycosyltransferase family 2 protein [Candidatus Daviesbacteria bacterium]
MKKVVVVLPTYNEKGIISTIIQQVLKQQDNLDGYSLEVLVSDSHSPDGTGQIVKDMAASNPQVHLLDVMERGLGTGYWRGFLYAKDSLAADILVGMDADGQHNPEDIPRLIKKLEQGYDFVTGSRYISEGGINEWPFFRRVLSYGANFIVQLLTGIWKIHEFTTSYRCFRAGLVDQLKNSQVARESSWVFAPILITEVISRGAKVAEVPIVFSKRAAGESKMATWEYIYDLLAYAAEFRLKMWNIKVPVLKSARKFKTLVKFGLVGVSGTVVDFICYVAIVEFFGTAPATAKIFSTEVAIVNNFTWNNVWTFGQRKVKAPLWKKFVSFNTISIGGLVISVLIIKSLTIQFGNEHYRLYFFVTIPAVMMWNFIMNHFFTWKRPKP